MERDSRKQIDWLGDSRDVVRSFPDETRLALGLELQLVQIGDSPAHWKPMKTVGSGVNELKIKQGDEYRVLYVAKFDEAVYVLHAFKKKTQKTAKKDLDLATARYRSLISWRSSNV
jgi:phage-related protein